MARLLRHCLANSLTDAQLVLPSPLIAAVIDGTIAELDAVGLEVRQTPWNVDVSLAESEEVT